MIIVEILRLWFHYYLISSKRVLFALFLCVIFQACDEIISRLNAEAWKEVGNSRSRKRRFDDSEDSFLYEGGRAGIK